jgi:hypothetical protein
LTPMRPQPHMALSDVELTVVIIDPDKTAKL